MQWTVIVVWLLVSTSVMAGGHFYLWRRLVRDAALPKGWRVGLSVLMVLLLFSQPAIFVLSRGLPRETVSPWAFFAFTWMGLLSCLFSLLLLTDLTRWVTRLLKRRTASQDEPTNPERRVAVRRMLAGGVAVSGLGLGGAGIAEVLGAFTVKKVEVELEKLPASFDGFRIVQLSDIHVGPTIGRDFIESMVETANELSPDLVAITGDLVDGDVQHLAQHTEPLRDLESKHGTYFCTGNHEYYSGADQWVRELERLGVHVLRNRRVEVSRGTDRFDLAGVTDHRAGSHGDPPDFEWTMRGRDPERELVLLAHQPAAVEQARNYDVGLQLSGHTHGGQFWPWNWFVHLVQPVVAGLARFGRTQVYVNTGTGYWGPPMRIGTESEITLITLRSARRMELARTSA